MKRSEAYGLCIAAQDGVLSEERFNRICSSVVMVIKRIANPDFGGSGQPIVPATDIPDIVAWAMNGEQDADMPYDKWKDDNYTASEDPEEVAWWIEAIIRNEVAAGRTDWTTDPAKRRERKAP